MNKTTNQFKLTPSLNYDHWGLFFLFPCSDFLLFYICCVLTYWYCSTNWSGYVSGNILVPIKNHVCKIFIAISMQTNKFKNSQGSLPWLKKCIFKIDKWMQAFLNLLVIFTYIFGFKIPLWTTSFFNML